MKFKMWAYRLFVLVMGVTTCIGIYSATRDYKEFDEKAYLVGLTIIAFMLFKMFAQMEKEVSTLIKSKQKSIENAINKENK